MRKIKVAVITGGGSPEHEVALRSGRTVIQHLPSDRFQIRAVKIEKNGRWSLLDGARDEEALFEEGEGEAPEVVLGKLRSWGVDAAFLALHGPGGEDGSIQGFLEIAGVPFTGSGVEACAVSMNKDLAKVLVRRAGIRVPDGQVLERREWAAGRESWVSRLGGDPGFPLYVKPLHQGSSIGAARVHDARTLARALDHAFELDDRVLLEPEISGREVTCGVVGEPDGWLMALPPVEIRPKEGVFFDYESKYDSSRVKEICPAPLEEKATSRVKRAALAAFRALGARGMARVDFILESHDLYFLELNAIPGLTPESILLKELRAAGILLDVFFSALVESALEGPFPPLLRSTGTESRGEVSEGRGEEEKMGGMGA